MTVIYQKQAGLTLIEVLIALAIVAIAMTAVIKATSQNIRSTNYLQTKTIAMWVADNLMNQVQVGFRKLPDPPDRLHEKINALGKDWFTTANYEDTPNKNIKQVIVHVYEQDPDRGDAQSVIDLMSYIYVTRQTHE